MTGGLYSRVKTWGATDTLTAADLNAEFDNVLNNFIPQMMQSYSATVVQMQIQTNPGAVGTESLAVALSGELERLRFQIAAITGNTYWYSAPGATISQLVTALGTATLANKVSSGLTNGVTGSMQPIFLKPDGTTNTVTLKGAGTPFVYTIAGTTYTISTDVAITSLTVAPASGNTCVVSDSTIDNTARTKLVGENGSTITVSGMGANVSALTGKLACFKTANASAEYILARVESTTQLSQVYRGYFFNSSNALMGRQTLNNADTLTLCKLTWIFATTAGGLLPVYTNPSVSGTAPSSPATGDYWFDLVANYWKSYNGTSWIQANATLIGTCFQDTTKTVGARSADFFEAYSDVNSIELFTESTTQIRAKNNGGQVSVYGTTYNFSPDFIQWNTTNVDSGTSLSASNWYYLYVNTQGNPLVSDTSPYDRRHDLKGFYHPANTYRCLGTVYYNASSAFDTIESFYTGDLTTPVTTMTAAVANFPLPYSVQVREQMIMLDATSGVFTQNVPPPYQWKGRALTYVKKDSTLNLITLQAWGDQKLSTTGTVAVGANTITTMGSTTGITAGNLVYGPGIPPGTTVSTVGSGNVTMGNNANLAVAGGTYKFANSTGIAGMYQTTLATQGESLTLFSDGTSVYIINRTIPTIVVNSGKVTLTSTGTAPTKGTTTADALYWWREGQLASLRLEYAQSGTATAGTGIYLFGFPTGISADPNYVTFYATTTDAFLPATYGAGQLSSVSGNSGGSAAVGIYDSTHFRITGFSLAPSYLNVGGGNYDTAQTCRWAVTFKFVALGWAGI